MSKRSWKRRIARATVRTVGLVGFLLVGVATLVALLRLMPDSIATAPVHDLTRHLAPDRVLALEAPTGAQTGERVSGAGVSVEPAGPQTFGDDAALDDLWADCEAGQGHACDRLFQVAPSGSAYERFGLSCGERPLVLDCQAELDGREPGSLVDGWPLPHALDGLP